MSTSPLARAVAAEIRAEIARTGVRAVDLADSLEPRQSLRWLSDRTAGVRMSIDDVERIAEALGVDPARLLADALDRYVAEATPVGVAST